MSTVSKREQALEACKKVINGIEDGTISVSSSLLLCKKIARLVNDLEGQEWLEYEYGGYPKDENGYIYKKAKEIANKHGRSAQIKKEDKIITGVFTELCEELAAIITNGEKAINNFTTQGYSVSGESVSLATRDMVRAVANNTDALMNGIKIAERRLSILKAQYYDYAVKWQIELQFGSVAKTIFDEYQTRVDEHFSLMPTTTVQKLNAIKDMMEDDNPERYAQVLTSCRRLWSEVAKTLFAEVLPNYKEKLFKTKAGKEIDISGDHDNNKLSAVIETLQSKATRNTIVGSETLYLIDWMEQINNRQSTGVHSEVTREQATQCIIHTYIALGDILALKVDSEM